jgi:glutathione synthase/RimK-type ligase-like ATP-grasp enzyme
MLNNVYIYYSGATDKTGSALAEALDIKSGRKAPGKANTDIVIGWGAKTDKDIDLGKAKVLNHPNAIRVNRNKLTALSLMQQAKVAVAPFASADSVITNLNDKKSTLGLPLIGRTNYHQGGANFWTCLTRTHVDDVINILNNGIKKKGYFQNYIDVKAEYRLHIVLGELIYAQRKVPRDDLQTAYAEQQSDKIKRMAEKKGEKIDDKTLEFALKYQGSKIPGADNIIRSNTRGWRFSNVNLEKVDKNLLKQAVDALKALNLEFGAVDCVLDAEGKPWIIEVNTGPGLEGTPFKKYVAAFQKAINNILKPPAKKAEKKATVKAAAPGKKTATAKEVGDKVNVDPEKLRMLADLMDNAEGDEKDAIASAAKRMFG